MIGDLTAPALGLSDEDRKRLEGVDHFFHLAAVYDMSADEETNRRANVDGTRNAVELANELGAKRFHHVSSIAVAGKLPRPLHRGHVRRGPEDRQPVLARPSSSPSDWCATS